MSVAAIRFMCNPDTGRLKVERPENILESKVKELFDGNCIYYMMRYVEKTNGPITFKAIPEKLTVSNVSTAFKAFGKLIEAKNMVRVYQEEDSEEYLEEKQAENKDESDEFMRAWIQRSKAKITLEKTDELQKAKVAFEEAKKSTGIEIEFNDL